MRFALYAAAAAMLSCAPVGAATIVEDFEGYAVGTQLYEFGSPYRFFGIFRRDPFRDQRAFANGALAPFTRIADLNGNKVLAVDIKEPGSRPSTYFDVRSFRTQPYPQNYLYTPTLYTLDILAPDGGFYVENRALGERHILTPGQWTTITENWTPRTYGVHFRGKDLRVFVTPSAGTIYLDNLTYDFTQSPIPEPASWGMMLAGFGLIGFAVRRRQMAPIAAR